MLRSGTRFMMTASAKRKAWRSDSSHSSVNRSVMIMAGWSLQIFNTDIRWCIYNHLEGAGFRNYSRFQSCLSDESMQSWTGANKHQGQVDGVPDTSWVSCSLAVSSCAACLHLHPRPFVPVKETTVSVDFTVMAGLVLRRIILSNTVNFTLGTVNFLRKQNGRKYSEENEGETNTPNEYRNVWENGQAGVTVWARVRFILTILLKRLYNLFYHQIWFKTVFNCNKISQMIKLSCYV